MANTSIKSAFERIWQHTMAAIDEAKSYTNTAVVNTKNDLLNGAGEAYDTLKELGNLIDDNTDAIQALENIATGKQDKITGTPGQFVVIGSDGKATTENLYTYSQTDLEAGVSALETGKLYFVYE